MANSSNPSYGTYQLTGLPRIVTTASRILPTSWLGGRLAMLIRKPVVRSFRRPVDTCVFGQQVRLHPYDNLSEKRLLFTPQLFDPLERKLLFERRHPNFVFVDLGANAGAYSLFVAEICGRGARILAVEPESEMFARLTYNLSLNSLRNVTAAKLAVCGKSGRVRVKPNAKNRGETRIVEDDGVGQRVRAVTLVELLSDHEIGSADAIKIDIEDGQFDVLDRFFRDADPSLYPRLMILENLERRGFNAAVTLALRHRYRLLVQARMNVVLERF